jgi:hypothetical protein
VKFVLAYSWSSICGISADEDDDANAAQGAKVAGNGAVTDAQVRELSALADEVGADKEKFCKYLKVDSLAAIPAATSPVSKSIGSALK